jgi:hypothetical protein
VLGRHVSEEGEYKVKKKKKRENFMHSPLWASSSLGGVTKPGHPCSIILARQSVKRELRLYTREQPLYG